MNTSFQAKELLQELSDKEEKNNTYINQTIPVIGHESKHSNLNSTAPILKHKQNNFQDPPLTAIMLNYQNLKKENKSLKGIIISLVVCIFYCVGLASQDSVMIKENLNKKEFMAVHNSKENKFCYIFFF